MSNDLHDTATAVRDKLSRKDPYYCIKKNFLAQIVAENFESDGNINYLKLHYDYSEFGLLPLTRIIELSEKMLNSVELKVTLSKIIFNSDHCLLHFK